MAVASVRYPVIVTNSASFISGSNIAPGESFSFQGGLSGSLQRTSGDISYLVAGSNVTVVTGSNGQITIASTASGSSSSSSFPLKYVVDYRFGGSPPTDTYNNVTTAIVAANAGTKPALVQVYDGIYAMGGTTIQVSGGVTIAGMTADPRSVILQGTLVWASGGDGGGVTNLTVNALAADTAPPLSITSPGITSSFAIKNAYLVNASTTPEIPAFYVSSAVGANTQIFIQDTIIQSVNGGAVIQEQGAVRSSNSTFTVNNSSKRAYTLGSGSLQSVSDKFAGVLRLSGSSRSLVAPVIDANGASDPAIDLLGAANFTLANPTITNGNNAYWIYSAVPVECALSGLALRATSGSHAHPNVNFSGGSKPHESITVRIGDVTGVGSYPSLISDVRHAPGADFDALTLPAQGFVVGGSVLFVQNTSTTYISRLTQGASTTIAGGSTYDLRPGEKAALVYDSTTSDYNVLTTRLQFGGDLDYGTAVGTQKVVGLQTRSVSDAAPTIGQFLGWSTGSNWIPTNQTPLRYIVDKTLAATPNTPAGYFQNLEDALIYANASASITQSAVVSIYPGQYTTTGSRFTVSNYVDIQGLTSNPGSVVIQKPIRFASGAVSASLNNVKVDNSTNEDVLSIYHVSANLTFRNCVINQTNSGNSKGVVRVDANGPGSTLSFFDCNLYAVDYDTVRTENVATLNFVRGVVECGRSDTAKRAVNVATTSGTVSVTAQDTLFTGAVQQTGASSITLKLLRGEISLTGNASIPVQFGGASAAINAGSYLRDIIIRNGSANETIDAGAGGISTTIDNDGLVLPVVGTIGDFVRPLYSAPVAPTGKATGGSTVVLLHSDRTVFSDNTGNLTLPDIVTVLHGTVIEVMRDSGATAQTVGVASGNYLDGTLNGTRSQTNGTTVRYVAFRVGFANPTWMSFL